MAETHTPDNLIAGTTQLVSRAVTVAAGASLPRGAVLGKITADGKYKLSDSVSRDGSETPSVVLAEPVDASAADVTHAAVYVKGEFNENALTFGSGITADSARDDLRGVGIYIKSTVGA